MVVRQYSKDRPLLKRKIAELERVRKEMKLEIAVTRIRPGHKQDLRETEIALAAVEKELRDMHRRYNEATSLQDVRD